MSKLYTQEHVEKLVELAFTKGRVFEAAQVLADAQARLNKLQPTPNMERLRIIHLCKEKQDVLMAPVPAGVSEYDAACEQEATVHYLDADINAAS